MFITNPVKNKQDKGKDSYEFEYTTKENHTKRQSVGKSIATR